MGSLRTGGSLRFQPVRTVDISTLCSQQKEEGTGKQIKTNSLYSEPCASSVSSALRVCFWVTCRSESLRLRSFCYHARSERMTLSLPPVHRPRWRSHTSIQDNWLHRV